MKQIKKKYGTPQEILYTICNAAWKLCRQNLARFSALKAFYTEALVTNALQEVEDAKKLPESRETISAKKIARINLINSTRKVRTNWQVLKVYITKAFAPDQVKTKLEAAGASLYQRASVDNWSAVRSLIETANTFIAQNLEQLKANENMPEEFQAAFKADGENCLALSVIYSHVNMEKEHSTAAKIGANNDIYASVIEMLKDGQQIFKNDVMMRRQFTFRYLMNKHRGEHPASLKGIIVNSLKTPVEGAVIVSQDGKYLAVTDRKGRYRIGRILAGTYTFTINCAGYNPIEQVITFEAAKATRGDFEITNALMKVA